MTKKKLLIIGSIPPPIGGVSIHVKRLLFELKEKQIDYEFINLKDLKKRELFFKLNKSYLTHLHTSSVPLKFLLSIYAFFFRKKLMITYHGDVNRFGKVKNYLDRLSIYLTYMPIVINEKSFKIAQKLNNRTQLISAFIPPPSIEELPEQIQNAIHDLQINYDQIFCTNAYNVSYDKYNREIYQISDLVSLFSTYTKKALIVSDPSGAYFKLLEAKKTIIPANIYFITIPHDFNAIIKESACMIRFTSTDGDSLSVKEALIAGVPVIATNVVDRPSGVTLVENIIQDLDQKIVENNFKAPVNFSDNGFITLEYIYKTHLSN